MQWNGRNCFAPFDVPELGRETNKPAVRAKPNPDATLPLKLGLRLASASIPQAHLSLIVRPQDPPPISAKCGGIDADTTLLNISRGGTARLHLQNHRLAARQRPNVRRAIPVLGQESLAVRAEGESPDPWAFAYASFADGWNFRQETFHLSKVLFRLQT